ncbi:MAG: glycosyltransferase family 39 protein [Candidatus Daviesbacteria bacterium]|nr:glycosyltransferase family 39 protein [Candidatus Daviesbacteria bacterium]
MKNNLIKILLILILILSAVVRIYRLDSVPPSISWDEAAVGYNAWTISEYGKDEYGKSFPLTFKSFGDDKHSVHIYLTAISVKLFGLSEFTTRLPAALFGIFNIFLIFYLGKLLFRNEWIGIMAAVFLAISPYHIQFSRFNHELNFALFFFLLGLITFIRGLEGRKWLLTASFISFGLDLLSYHSAKVVVIPFILILILMYFQNLWKMRIYFFLGIVFLLFFLGLIFLNPTLLGIARAKQTALPQSDINDTKLYKFFQNQYLGYSERLVQNYLSHFNPEYLFIKGGENTKFSTHQVGEFYKIDALFLLVGFLALVLKKTRTSIILLSWALLAPIPSSLTNEAPHAGRALYMMGSWHLVSVYGFYIIFTKLKGRKFMHSLIAVTFFILFISFITHLKYYFEKYPRENAIDWQYGMKQVVEFIKTSPQYNYIYMTDSRFQPYIFFLYYLKTPLPEYLLRVVYNNSESKSYSMVSYFDKYFFGGWDTAESVPQKDVLYILTPYEYDGLKYKSKFDIRKKVQYPNGIDAFFIVSGN